MDFWITLYYGMKKIVKHFLCVQALFFLKMHFKYDLQIRSNKQELIKKCLNSFFSKLNVA